MGDPTSDDYYKVLGVPRDASEQDISKAYKKSAVRWHPDKNGGDPTAEEAFKKVAEAYDCLSKPDKRAAYDRFGKDGVKGGMGGGGGGANFDHAQAEEIFKTFFGGQDPFDVLLRGGGMPGGFGMNFASMHGSGRGGCCGGQGGGPKMMFSSMGGGMPGGMPGGMGFGPEMAFGGMPGMGGLGGMGGRGVGGRSVRPKRSPGFSELLPGSLVSLSGLKAAPQQNGRHGRVLSYDPERQRYTVRLLEDGDEGGNGHGGGQGQQLAVRVANLHSVVDVQLVDLSVSPELNGSRGRLLSFDPLKERYHVRLHDGRMAALAPAQIVAPAGTPCTVVGLQAAAAQQHNGGRAKLVGYDAASGRYEVMVSPGTHLKLKRENVRV